MNNKKIKYIIEIFAIILLVVLICILIMKISQKNRLESERQELLNEIEIYMDTKENYQSELEWMESGEYLEKRARELGLIKDGETIWKKYP